MAYYLDSGDGSTSEYVSIPAFSEYIVGQEYAFEFEIAFDPTQNFRPFGRVDSFNARFYKLSSSSDFALVLNGGSTIFFTPTSTINYNNFNVFRIHRTNSDFYEFSINGVLEDSGTLGGGIGDVNVLLTNISVDRSRSPTQLKYMQFEVNGSVVRYYDPSASNGTGLTLPDTIGSQDGSLQNYPNDDSQWVFYSDGPTTPINLGVTNLQATSARLTWEQG